MLDSELVWSEMPLRERGHLARGIPSARGRGKSLLTDR